MNLRRCFLYAMALSAGAVACVHSSAAAQSVVPIRELTHAESKSDQHFGTILGVHPLARGRLLVNDAGGRQLLVLDSALQVTAIVVDADASAKQSYGPLPSSSISYRGDSVMFVDRVSSSLVVITPDGNVARVVAPPHAGDILSLAGSRAGADLQGNLIYRAAAPEPPRNFQDRLKQSIFFSTSPDSEAIVRANFATRLVDTIGWVRVDGRHVRLEKTGETTIVWSQTNALPTIDEWVVLSDGSVAFVRGHDYHVDIITADGRKVLGPKMPFDFKRVTDSEKLALVDSARNAREKKNAELMRSRTAGSASAAAQPARTITSDAGPPPPSATKRAEVEMQSEFSPPSDMSDYWPPIRRGAAMPDLDSNLWILPTTSGQSKQGELVYDVVNNRGELKERVRMPLGRSLAGFGHNGAVYLMSKDNNGWILERYNQ